MTTPETEVFRQDVINGLKSQPKKLSSKYFYDEVGDKLFQQIMHMKEYYLTNCEYEIMDIHKQVILDAFRQGVNTFDLVEFGAGDGLKTKVLLRHFVAKQADFHYAPVDISGDVLEGLKHDLNRELPNLSLQPLNYEYFTALQKLNELDKHRKVILFMGGNIGNFDHQGAVRFLQALKQELVAGDLVMIGFDLKKDPQVIREAYGDAAGITRAFNMNLLERINRELGADFNLSAFSHYGSYNPLTGNAESFLISTKQQQVTISSAGKTIAFDQWEPIHVEISKKYNLSDIEQLRVDAGFDHVANYFDCKHWFVDTLWKV